MRARHRVGLGTLSAVVGAAWLAVVVAGQAPGSAGKESKPEFLTPWGEPDLNGIWQVGYVFTPLQRPKELAGKEVLTDEEVAALETEHAQRMSGDGAGGRARAKRGTDEDLAGAYNQVFSRGGSHEKVIRTKRTSLIVDPPDGRIPPLTPEGQKRLASLRQNAPNESGPGGIADHPEQRRNDRCMGTTLPFIKGVSSGARRIVQSPGAVAMFLEDGHVGGAYRTISVGASSPLPSHLRQYLGDSRGRWDGNTFVVEVTNFSEKTNFEGSAENLKLTERYTRAGPDLLMLQITVEDPSTFTRPWTIELPLTKLDEKANQIYESSCHEGNYALTSILAGARALERERAGAGRRTSR
jgi:hypothetical protein